MTYFWETVDTIAPGLGWPHFGPFHLAVLAVFLLLGAVLCRGYCGMDTDKRRRWRRTVALLLVADELFKDFGLLYGGNFSLDYLPLHLCSINIFLIVLHAWRRPKLLDTFLYFVCLPAACAALLFPTWAPLPPLNFMVIHSFTVHFLLALYPLALTLRGDMDPQPRAFPRCFALLAAMAVPIWFFNRAFGTNFMFLMRAGEGNPPQALRALRQPSARLPRASRRGVRRDVSVAARAAPTHRRARRQIKPSADPARPAGAGRFICELSVSFHFPA